MLQLFLATLPLLANVATAAPARNLIEESSSACRIVWVTASEDLPQTTTSAAMHTDVPIKQGYIAATKPAMPASITKSAVALAKSALHTSEHAANTSVPINQDFLVEESTSACRIVWVTALPETTVEPPSEASAKAIGHIVPSADGHSNAQSDTTMQTPSQVASTQSPRRTSSVPATRTSAGANPTGETTRPVSVARKNVVYFTNWYVCAIALSALHCLGATGF